MKVMSGVRAHHRPAWTRGLASWLAGRRLGERGSGVVIDRNVEFLRYPRNIQLGDHVLVKEGARICPASSTARIRIGAHTTVGYHTFMFAHAGIEIGANCLIAPFCYLVDNNHGVRRDGLIREQMMSAEPIRIGSDVWLGVGVTILKGVSIGDGAVVGAGCVVDRDIPEYAIVRSAPCEVFDSRR